MKGDDMKKLYVEAALDAYKYLDRNIKLLDTKITRKAMGAVRNYNKPCEELAVEIIELQAIKFDLVSLKKAIDEVLADLKIHTKAYVYRNYLHLPLADIPGYLPLKNTDRLLSKFGAAMEAEGIDNRAFKEMSHLKVIRASLYHVTHKKQS